MIDDSAELIDPDEISSIIADYRSDAKYPEYLFRNRDRFEIISFIHWALDELESYILSRPYKDPISSTNAFIRKMSEYMYSYPKTQNVFFIASEAAMDIREILIFSRPARKVHWDKRIKDLQDGRRFKNVRAVSVKDWLS